MHSKRIRSLLGSLFLVSWVLGIAVTPAAAATCTLTAPASVAIGSLLTVDGSGFPASAAVDVSITIDNGTPDEFTAQTDAAGAFQLNLTPDATDQGQTTIAASSGAACSAQVVVAVGSTAGESTPQPSEETGAAAGAGTGAGAPPPRTDSVLTAVPGSQLAGNTIWLSIILLATGIAGLVFTRPMRAR